jgi:hypothetical protein
MPANSEKSQLKVCCTCGFWSYQYKGFCHRLEQGVGKFWMCEDWSAAAAAAKAEESLPDAPEVARAGAIVG